MDIKNLTLITKLNSFGIKHFHLGGILSITVIVVENGMIFKRINFTSKCKPNRCYHSNLEWTWEQ